MCEISAHCQAFGRKPGSIDYTASLRCCAVRYSATSMLAWRNFNGAWHRSDITPRCRLDLDHLYAICFRFYPINLSFYGPVFNCREIDVIQPPGKWYPLPVYCRQLDTVFGPLLDPLAVPSFNCHLSLSKGSLQIQFDSTRNVSPNLPDSARIVEKWTRIRKWIVLTKVSGWFCTC